METLNYKKKEKQVETLTNRTKIVKERSNKMSFVSLDLKWSLECQFCFCLHLENNAVLMVKWCAIQIKKNSD